MSRMLPGPVANEDLNDLTSPLKFLETRRSALAKAMGAPGPDAQQVEQLLEMAVRVPDHGKLSPWRFIVFEGEGRAKIGDVLADRWRQLHPEHGDETIELQRQTFLRAPVVIAVVSSPVDSAKVPEWEQVMSAGAVCHNLVLGAGAMGFGSQWISGWCSFDRPVLEKMGLNAAEKLAGFIYVGTANSELSDRPRPDHNALTTHWDG